MRRLVLAVAAVGIGGIAVLPASAQQLSMAAMECAVLALIQPEDDPDREEAARLFALGYRTFIEGFSAELLADREGLRQSLGGAGFLADMSVDFFAGQAFAIAIRNVEEHLDEAVPRRPDAAIELDESMRWLEAGNQFTLRNCRFLGQ